MKNQIWNLTGVSVAGTSHLSCGLPNQDSFLRRKYTWGEFIGVSDGLGSKPYSGEGARLACMAAAIAARYYVKSPCSSISAMSLMIHALWKVMINNPQADLFSSTCLYAFRSDNLMIFSQLGDGLAGVCMSDGKVNFISDKKNDSFVNITDCLSEKHRPSLWRTRCLEADQCQAVFLMTDGISAGVKEGKEAKFLELLYSHISSFPPIKRSWEIRRWVRKWKYPNDSDDKTIACMIKGNDREK